jgi:hypothetical protein
MKTMRYWFQIRLMTNPARGYFVNVGVGIYDVASGAIVMRLADDAPEQAHWLAARLMRAVQQAHLPEQAHSTTPTDALLREMGAHPGGTVQPGPLLGMTTREPIEKLLEDTYQEQVA